MGSRKRTKSGRPALATFHVLCYGKAYFDHDGLAIRYERLEVGCFQVPDAGDRDGIELDARNWP